MPEIDYEPRSIEDREDRVNEIGAELTKLDHDYKGKKMPTAVRDEWNRLNAEREQHTATIKEMRARQERLRELVNNPRATEQFNAGAGHMVALTSAVNPWGTRDDFTSMSHRDVRARALDAAGQVGADSRTTGIVRQLTAGSTWQARQAAEHVLATSDPAYERAFYKLLADPVAGHRGFTLAESQAFTRAMALSPETAGGHVTVPFQLDPSFILSSDGSVDPMRQISRRVMISGTDKWKGVRTEGVVAHWYPEAGEVSDDSPTVQGPEIQAHRASAYVEYSIELDEDAATLRSELGRLFTDARAQIEAAAFTTGTGTDQPRGLVTALTGAETVTSAGVAAFAADDAYAIVEAVPARFRPRMRVLANLPTINAARRLTSDTEPAIVPDTFDRWLGRPLLETTGLDDDATTGNTIVAAGDFTHYVIVDRVGMSVELVPHVMGANRRPTGQRGLFAHWRVGGDVTVANAFRKLVVQ